MTSQKPGLHPRNRHRSRYDMKALCLSCPELQDFIVQTPAGEPSVNFADPLAVKTLNKALLAHFYGVAHWDIPEGFLCPPVPGRADYVHHLADLLADDRDGAGVNICLRCTKNRRKSATCMSMICQQIVRIYRSKNKQIIIKFLR